MESCKPFSQSFTNSTHMIELRNSASNLMNHSGKTSSPQSINKQNETNLETPEGVIGYLDVFIHQAHNIHNICIYHKQDVYAKLSLTGNPETAIESKVIRSAGGNPVFNEKLQLSVQNIESSLRCEIWMRSAAPSHLEDQLLGFVLIPLSDVIVAQGKLEKEFALSTNDLFHSAAGFVQLSISYVGSYPDVMAVAPPPVAVFADTALPDSENEDSITSKFAKMEFVDWQVMNENNQMVSELFGVPCTEMDSQSTENLINPENGECHTNEEAGIRFVESFSTENSIISASGNDTPVSCVSVNGSPAISDQNQKEKESETDDTIMQPLINVSVEPEQSVMPNDIVDLYMKAMQESLASMKLPMDIENNNINNDDDNSNNNNNSKESGNSSAEQKIPASMRTGTRVFYGSRAFF
ncbi:C2 domain-containing protein [Dioscorea alata]|uniref:C2 domain-containing protein n=2 Tax=Dioscorea alata TaxID=55571 RepID=A0ACB7UXL0_DIOAL|nr:C2 domain-containing protein [Dioscorea alata]KAH7665506.1 C2 domain-containing protein [Dioscorea alata]